MCASSQQNPCLKIHSLEYSVSFFIQGIAYILNFCWCRELENTLLYKFCSVREEMIKHF